MKIMAALLLNYIHSGPMEKTALMKELENIPPSVGGAYKSRQQKNKKTNKLSKCGSANRFVYHGFLCEEIFKEGCIMLVESNIKRKHKKLQRETSFYLGEFQKKVEEENLAPTSTKILPNGKICYWEVTRDTYQIILGAINEYSRIHVVFAVKFDKGGIVRQEILTVESPQYAKHRAIKLEEEGSAALGKPMI